MGKMVNGQKEMKKNMSSKKLIEKTNKLRRGDIDESAEL